MAKSFTRCALCVRAASAPAVTRKLKAKTNNQQNQSLSAQLQPNSPRLDRSLKNGCMHLVSSSHAPGFANSGLPWEFTLCGSRDVCANVPTLVSTGPRQVELFSSTSGVLPPDLGPGRLVCRVRSANEREWQQNWGTNPCAGPTWRGARYVLQSTHGCVVKCCSIGWARHKPAKRIMMAIASMAEKPKNPCSMFCSLCTMALLTDPSGAQMAG